jgi:hypothetical protein
LGKGRGNTEFWQGNKIGFFKPNFGTNKFFGNGTNKFFGNGTNKFFWENTTKFFGKGEQKGNKSETLTKKTSFLFPKLSPQFWEKDVVEKTKFWERERQGKQKGRERNH